MWGFEMHEIGKRVTALRISKQISQRRLAELCGVSQPTIANIERGRTTEVKGFVLEALARELNTTSAFLLNGSESSADHETTMRLAELEKLFVKLPESEQITLLVMTRAIADQLPKPAPKQKIPKKSIAVLQ